MSIRRGTGGGPRGIRTVGESRARVAGLLTIAGAALALASCSDPVPVGPASPSVTCGAGTVLEDDTCTASTPPAGPTCGSGTLEQSGACVATQVCGEGTRVEKGRCVPVDPVEPPADAGPAITCGKGTREENGTCLPVGELTCGAGTRLVEDECLPLGTGADTYDVRVEVTELPGDGFTSIPVFLFGRRGDGTAALDPVVIDVDRPGAGSFDRSAVTLTETGATLYFTPCNVADSPSCAGPVQLVVYLATDTSQPVATSRSLQIVAPTGVGSPAPCLVGGNVAFFDGDASDYIHPGRSTITQGTWTPQALNATTPQNIGVHLVPSDEEEGAWWDFDFSTTDLGQPLQVQVYEGAERIPFESPGHPGISISGDGRGCNTISGRFQIHDLELSNTNVLLRLTATFEQHCEAGTSTLRGCVHYEQ